MLRKSGFQFPAPSVVSHNLNLLVNVVTLLGKKFWMEWENAMPFFYGPELSTCKNIRIWKKNQVKSEIDGLLPLYLYLWSFRGPGFP